MAILFRIILRILRPSLIATLLFAQQHSYWWVAGIAGAAMSLVWNYAVSSVLTWRSR